MKMKMFISARTIFKEGDEDWSKYIEWIQLPQLKEVRTIDATLNKYVDNCGDIFCDYCDIYVLLETFPKVNGINQYYLLAIDESIGIIREMENDKNIKFLGCDLADVTYTSSLLNCGPWEGQLTFLTNKLNHYGLLDLDSAKTAQSLLPQIWGTKDPHSSVDIYGLFEIAKYGVGPS